MRHRVRRDRRSGPRRYSPRHRCDPTHRARTRSIHLYCTAVQTRRLADQGLRGTSVTTVAREAGLSPSAVYFHFADKEALFIAAFNRGATRMCDDALALPGPVDTVYWQQVVGRFATATGAYPFVHRVLAGREPELLAGLADGDVPQRNRVALEASVRAGQESGTVAGDVDPHDTAIVLEAISTAVVTTVVQFGGRARRDGSMPSDDSCERPSRRIGIL
ncbi:TetR/AcrR family transcriptional regulator [Nocardia sp. NPDC052112]|uniref:TetR/AcrR family transcriptional regulator n=1 Tax=Nocardia sp. NPDC052112 TaxID=3155646 RepID=UPI0034394FE2